MVEPLGAREAPDGQHRPGRPTVRSIGERGEVEPVVADIHLRGDATRAGVALFEEPAVEFAAGDDAVRVAQFLAQVDRGTVQVGAGVDPDRERDRPLHQAWAWARQHADQYDHVLAYWGNYAGTCGHLFHRLMERPVPFSIWVHARTARYRAPVSLR